MNLACFTPGSRSVGAQMIETHFRHATSMKRGWDRREPSPIQNDCPVCRQTSGLALLPASEPATHKPVPKRRKPKCLTGSQSTL